MSEKLEPPNREPGDIAHAIARAGLSSIPVVGGAVTELFQLLISPPLEKRRDQWMNEVGQALKDLQEKQAIELEVLQSNEIFIDTVLQASQIAMRNSQEEKRKALCNAVINSALPNSPEQSLQQIFLSYIDVFTVWHLRLLNLFQNPPEWAQLNNHQFPSNRMTSSLSVILTSAFPELGENRPMYDQIWNELYSRGLVNTEGLHTMMTPQGALESRVTELGMKFLLFIGEPISSD